MNARNRDLSNLADDLCMASDYLRALEAAKWWRCARKWDAENRINGLMRHTDKLIYELLNIFKATGISKPPDKEVDRFR